jgi:hypothetical protein
VQIKFKDRVFRPTPDSVQQASARQAAAIEKRLPDDPSVVSPLP